MADTLDVTGSDDMVVDKYYYPKTGALYLMAPTGRKCATCFLRDDGWDPRAIAVLRKKMCTVWSQSRDPANGEN